ncbi:MAG: lipocalin family protein [Pseudomonadota bacterium]
MRYSEMKAFEKERAARQARGQSSERPLLLGAGKLIWWPVLLLVMLGLILVGCASQAVYRDTGVAMTTQGKIDLGRYLGLWYEIARFPNSFEEGCVGVTAEYAQNSDGTIRVLNTCRQGALDGPVEVAEGVATVNNEDGDRLEVTFVPWLPFAKGDYWILATDYQVAVIGTPSGSVGWVLARTPSLPADKLAAALDVLTANGYDTAQIYLTPQAPR